MRYSVFALMVLLTMGCTLLGALVHPNFYWGLVFFAPLSITGVFDVIQTKHSVLRNYPILGHIRWFFEMIRPELRQYLFSSDIEELPFSRERRSLVYQRAKDVEDRTPFGTKFDVYEAGYAWINQSMAPKPVAKEGFRVEVGRQQCDQPYSSSVLNISGMSFGALSGNAIAALNEGARMGNFAHDTGEGSISRHHKRGGDVIWQIGTGYFGCRAADGGFDPEQFKERSAADNVKMIEVKISQGAKPGHGGVLPGSKVTDEIAEARGVPIGMDCLSPAGHTAFSTPKEFIEFMAKLRAMSGGKPVGFKACIGHRWEFLAVIKAMIELDSYPDFIVIDGAEGGTGAAPQEFSNHIGTPLVEGLTFAQNALTGAGVRDKVRLAASGKVVSAFDMVHMMALGADWCNSARGFMFAIGCIQAQACHTNECPSGVATQDKGRARAIVVEDKAQRVYNYHHNTMHALAEVVAAAGLEHTDQLRLEHFMQRCDEGKVVEGHATDWLEPGELVYGTEDPDFRRYWAMADADSFAPGA